jgi:hypothetical protein
MKKCPRSSPTDIYGLMFLLTLVLGLTSSFASDLPVSPESAISGTAERIPYVAFIGPVQSPLIKHLLALEPVVQSGDRRANLLVVDGDAYSGTMADEKALRNGWKMGKGLLVLDADEGDLKGDLVRLTGFVPSKGVAAVYLRKRRDGGIDEVCLDRKARSLDSGGRRAQHEFVRRVDKAFREELPALPIQRRSSGRENTLPTSDEFHLGPFRIASVINVQISGTISGLFSDTTLPQETATLTLNDQIDVYGSGSAAGQAPATAFLVFQGFDTSSVQAFPPFSLGFTLPVAFGYANPQHQRLVGVALDYGTPVTSWLQPGNAQNQSTVTSGVNFTVGVTPQGPDANVNYSTLTSTPISGWTVFQGTIPTGENASMFQWTYQEQLDNNGNNMSGIYSNLFSNGTYMSSIGGNYTPSALAAGGVQSAPGVVWTTTESEGSQQAEFTSQVNASNIFWVYDDPLLDPSSVFWSLGSNDVPTLFVSADGSQSVSLADLWNQMGYVSSVSVPATVSGGTQMSVSVTLDHPAPRAGMPLIVSSSAPSLIPTQYLQVPPGQETASFQIPVYAYGTGVVTLQFSVNGVPLSATTTVQ